MLPIKPLTDEGRILWLQLVRSENVGPKRVYDLMMAYGTIEVALEKAKEIARHDNSPRRIVICPREKAEREYEQTLDYGARVVAQCEPEFPDLMRQIKSCPSLLTMKGNVSMAQKHKVAIVGARNASLNGKNLAKHMAHEIGKEGWLVISGLARGVDTAAHYGALDYGTIAVIAGGIDHVYPSENKGIYQKICEQGLIITETPFGARPKSHYFPRRNRIISGMSAGTLVVEAAQGSGSLITAKYAIEQKRELFAVPGSPLDPRSKGCNLLRNGALIAEEPEDIIKQVRHNQYLFQAAASEPGKKYSRKRLRKNTYDLKEVGYPKGCDVTKAREIVFSALGPAPTKVDDIILQTSLAPNIVMVILLEMELEGRLEFHGGNSVSLLYDYMMKNSLALAQ